MRAFTLFVFFTALLTRSAVARSAPSPCAAFSRAELREVLGGKPIPPDPSTMGEETAPSCTWTVRGGRTRVKIEIWSGEELRVVEERTARDFFKMRKREALEFGGNELVHIGEGAYGSAILDGSVEIGVLKDHRFIIFSFDHVRQMRALAFAKMVVRRI